MSVCFRVDANSHIGVGHLMRCLALAQALDEQMVEVYFFIRQSTRENCLSRHDWVGRLCLIPDEIALEQEPQWIQQQALKQDASLLILDGYQFHPEYRQQLRALLQPHTIPLVLYDDTNSDLCPKGLLHADVVVNTAPTAERLNYEATAPDAKLCLGSGFQLLRQEFYVQESVAWARRHSLTIVMGGSDVNNLTIPIIEALDAIDFPAPVRVLTGSAYPFAAELKRIIANSALAIQHLPNCQTVADVFSHSKLVLSSGGSSQFELLTCATPAILTVVADNQLPATIAAKQQGWCDMMDCRGISTTPNTKQHITGLVERVQALWQDAQQLEAMFVIAQRLQTQQLQTQQLQTRYALIEQLLSGE